MVEQPGVRAAAGDAAPAKRALRAELLAARARRTPSERHQTAGGLCRQALSLPELAAAGPLVVACYASRADEPATGPLLDALALRGATVLLPVLLEDLDLDWAVRTPGADQVGRFGIREPSGPRLGRDAIASASVVFCPALAADRAGHRLGRGGASYDRALARVAASALVVALVHDDELLDSVPVEAHDRPVDIVLTDRRTLRAPRERSGPDGEP